MSLLRETSSGGWTSAGPIARLIPGRLRVIWHVLRGRPVLYRLEIHKLSANKLDAGHNIVIADCAIGSNHDCADHGHDLTIGGPNALMVFGPVPDSPVTRELWRDAFSRWWPLALIVPVVIGSATLGMDLARWVLG